MIYQPYSLTDDERKDAANLILSNELSDMLSQTAQMRRDFDAAAIFNDAFNSHATRDTTQGYVRRYSEDDYIVDFDAIFKRKK
jgi:hypothetical protein